MEISAATSSSRRRKGLPRSEQVARNREELLTAALKVFRELGYSGASLDAIADQAGFSKGAVYSHFTSKADLFLSLLESRIAARRDSSLRAAAIEDPLAVMTSVFAETRADRKWRLAVLEFRVVAARDPELNKRYARAHAETIAGSRATIQALVDRRKIRPDLPIDILAVAGLILDAGAFLEDVAQPGVASETLTVELYARLLGVDVMSSLTSEGDG
jgi:AcrR family transcriptional regulator